MFCLCPYSRFLKFLYIPTRVLDLSGAAYEGLCVGAGASAPDGGSEYRREPSGAVGCSAALVVGGTSAARCDQCRTLPHLRSPHPRLRGGRLRHLSSFAQ